MSQFCLAACRCCSNLLRFAALSSGKPKLAGSTTATTSRSVVDRRPRKDATPRPPLSLNAGGLASVGRHRDFFVPSLRHRSICTCVAANKAITAVSNNTMHAQRRGYAQRDEEHHTRQMYNTYRSQGKVGGAYPPAAVAQRSALGTLLASTYPVPDQSSISANEVIGLRTEMSHYPTLGKVDRRSSVPTAQDPGFWYLGSLETGLPWRALPGEVRARRPLGGDGRWRLCSGRCLWSLPVAVGIQSFAPQGQPGRNAPLVGTFTQRLEPYPFVPTSRSLDGRWGTQRKRHWPRALRPVPPSIFEFRRPKLTTSGIRLLHLHLNCLIPL